MVKWAVIERLMHAECDGAGDEAGRMRPRDGRDVPN